MISDALSQSLGELRHELIMVDGLRSYAIFGSTALILRGILNRDPGDIDVFVSRPTWAKLFARAGMWDVETPRAGDPPLLVDRNARIPIHVFYDWRDEAVAINVSEVLTTAEVVGYTWKCATVWEVLRQKEAAYRVVDRYPKVAKHLPDIEACRRFLDPGDTIPA